MRIAITGPESSGKTTLALHLAEGLGSVYIPEFAREYLLERNGIYEQQDLVTIAKGQFDSWEKMEDQSSLVSDTEMLVMKVWSDFKYGQCDPAILELLNKQHFDYYFLCRPDIEWEEDPLREHPEQREELFEIYLTELKNRNLPFSIVEGNIDKRLIFCMDMIQQL